MRSRLSQLRLPQLVLILIAAGSADQPPPAPFFGPTQRADGVFQLYLELPYLHYLEVDSKRYDARVTGRPAKPWAEAVRESSVEGISRQYSLG